jgi:hypothetical protein
MLSGLMLCLFASGSANAQGYDNDPYDDQATYQQFYDELSPYGEWVNDPEYGYVWVPDAGPDFRPYYSNGYWVNTEYGNTWYSGYSWGWAPFHYGRWTYSSYYGWLWIPGNVWGPAWVSWRSGGGCYGWAPLGPGISINVAVGGYSCPDYWWTFTPQQYILSSNFRWYCYGPRYAPQYVHQTTIINNTYVYNHNTYISGPRRRELENAIGRPVQTVAINNSPRPMRSELRGNTISLFRPAIAESRPRATERPREFTNARQPVIQPMNNAAPRTSGFDRRSVQPAFGGRGGEMQPQQQAPVQQFPRNAWGSRQQEVAPRQERPRADPVMQTPQQMQPDRGFDRRPQMQTPPVQTPDRGWGRVERAPMAQPEQHMERPQPFNRGAEMQRAQEMQRPQVMQQRMERPMPAPVQQRPQMQRMERPGAEAPRPQPAQAPARNFGGEGRRFR